jgi:subtilase family serine protease
MDPATSLASLRLVLKPSAEQAADLEKLLEEQRDPGSANFQKWLTPENYGDRFGASENDLAALSAWLQSRGFTLGETARAHNWISFSGTAGLVSYAFQTQLRHYQTGGERHFANATEASIPEAFAGVVESIRGLTDFRPAPQRTARLKPDFTSSNTSHYLAPDDLAAIYDISPLYAAGYDGTGQKLVIAGQTDINLADIRAFRSQFGLPAKDPQVVLYGADPGVSPGDQIEADLDLEWSGAVARNATIIYVNSQNVFESVQYAIDKNLAPVISMSYGACEAGSPASYRTMAQQANAEGITWMNSSGDSGAAGCDYDVTVATHGPAVTFPADIPEITAVGGTEFSEAVGMGWSNRNSATLASATGWMPEKAWNDTTSGGWIAATGGGASASFRKPWWQTGPGVPNDNARDVPDVSLSASADHDGYLLYAGGKLQAVGGTSASSPVFAGIVAILNQYLVAKGAHATAGLGNINPNLYSLAQNASLNTTTGGIFHDITVGDNIVPCKAGTPGCTTGSFGYRAGPGYDLVTGLGSVDANNLVTKWAALPATAGTTATLTASPLTISQSGTTQLTVAVKPVTGANVPTGAVTFSNAGTVLGSAALVSGAASIAVKGSALSIGADNITASYAATGNFAGSTASVTVTVTASALATTTTVTATPAAIAASGSTQLTVTVKPASGAAAPTGSVVFSVGGKALGTAALTSAGAAATALLKVNGTSLALGANNVTATYPGSAAFAGSSASATVTVVSPAVGTTMTITASPASIAQNASTQLTFTVKPASGSVLPTGAISLTNGTVVLGSATLAASTGASAATITVKGSSLVAGKNTLTAVYAGMTGFAGATATVQVTVAAAAAAAANVALSTAKGPATVQRGFPVTVQIQEQAGVATSLTGLTINGTSFSSAIAAFFGATTLPANGKLSTSLVVEWSPLPANLTFVVSGVDGAGHQWSQTSTVATGK